MFISDFEISDEKIKLRHLYTQKISIRSRIVDIHNHFRASGIPPAKNMLKMVSLFRSHYNIILLWSCIKVNDKIRHKKINTKKKRHI